MNKMVYETPAMDVMAIQTQQVLCWSQKANYDLLRLVLLEDDGYLENGKEL